MQTWRKSYREIGKRVTRFEKGIHLDTTIAPKKGLE